MPSDIYTLASIHCTIGGIAGLIAWRKGLSPVKWILYGQLGGTIALIAVLSVRKENSDI